MITKKGKNQVQWVINEKKNGVSERETKKYDKT